MGNHGGHAIGLPQTYRDTNMSTVTIQMPESLAQQIREWAAREGVSVDQLLSSAAAEKLSALMTVDHLRERARRAKREDFVRFLESSPDVPPMAGDEP